MLKSILRKTKKIIEKKLIKYIVWDFDDTLYVNLKLGTKLKKCYLDYLNEKSKENVSSREFNLLTKNGLSWSGLVAKKLKKSEIKIINEVEKRFNKSQYLKKNSSLVNQLEKLTKYRHVILTNSPAFEVEQCLKKIGFKKKNNLDFFPFEKIIDCNLSKKLKPDLTPFKKVTDYTKIHPIRHLMIGNSYHSDLLPAKKAGFQAILIEEVPEYLKIKLKQ